MSQELITYSTALPDFLKEAGGYRDEGLTAGIAPRAPKLSVTTAKQWTITDEGNTMILQSEITDGNGRKSVQPTPYVRGVIIASSGTLTKAWYEKAYVPGTNAAPDCFSNDGKTPAPGVAKPQCANCAQCPKNAFGSHPVTGRGKACGDRKMIVVALDSMPDKFATFNLPTMSLQSLAKIDGQLKSSNIPLQSVMMEFSFDPSIAYPVVKIGAVGFIGKEHFEKFREAADTDEVSSLLREVDYEPGTGETAPAPVVPNNVIAFGSGSQSSAQQTPVEPKEPELTPKQKAAAELKAQLAALEAEDDDDETNTNEQATHQDQQTETASVLGGGQANAATDPAAGAASAPKRTRRSKAEMEAVRAAQAQQQPLTGTALEQGVAQTLEPEPEPEVQTQQTAPVGTGAPNVLDLLSKWANK